jgi:hypothetical protein
LTGVAREGSVEEMKRILYAGGSFITGDGIADAVMDYAAELANAGKAAKLVVPALDLEQRPESVALVIGPSSQLLAEPVAVGHEITDDAFTDALNLRIRLLREKSGMVDGGDVAAFERRRAV